MNFVEFYLNEMIGIGIDSSKPPISGFKKIFMSWPEDVRMLFVRAINAWHGTTMEDNTPELLINFSKKYPKEMDQYHQWLKSLISDDSFILYRGFSGNFAEQLAEKIWDAIKTNKPYIEIELKEYNPWSTNVDVAKMFSDAVVIKHEWNIDNVFHADAGRGFLKQIPQYAQYVKLSRTEREIVIKHSGTIKIDPVKDVILKGKFRSRQLRLNKKLSSEKIKNFINKLEIGKTYLPKSDIELPIYWEDILEKGGLVYLGTDENKLKFKWPDGSEYSTDKLDWLSTYLDY